MSARSHRSGIAGPVILIGLGVVFLLNNMGMLSWSVWDVVLRLWPLLLVAWGLDLMIGRRSAWGAATALIIVLALIAGGVYMMDDTRLPSDQVLEFDLPLEDARQAQITLDPAVAYLRLSAAEDSDPVLLGGRVLPFNGERVEQDIQRRGSELEARVYTAGVIVMPFFSSTANRASWDFSLNP
ncbi:MAG: hypothetical protein E4G99_13390, partial [Anaerolineales bacterium]